MSGAVDVAEAFRHASGQFIERLRAVGHEQWHASTPCTDWDVRQLVNHVAGEYLWVPELMSGKRVADVGDRYDGDVLGADPVSTVTVAQQRAAEAFAAPGALESTVHLSFGDVPGTEYATQMYVDSVIHSWDLARAIGADERLDPELVEMTYAYLQQMAPAWRSAGAFGAEKTPADDSTQAKLLALTGR